MGRQPTVEYTPQSGSFIVRLDGRLVPVAAIQNLAKANVNAFKDAFVQMNFGELISCLEIQVLNVIRIRKSCTKYMLFSLE